MREITFLTIRHPNVMEDQVYNNLGLVVEEFLVIPIILSLFSVRESGVEYPWAKILSCSIAI